MAWDVWSPALKPLSQMATPLVFRVATIARDDWMDGVYGWRVLQERRLGLTVHLVLSYLNDDEESERCAA